MAHATGDRVGRYRLREPIGSGGMGVVFRAHDPQLGRDVALKLLRPGGAGSSATGPAEARLLREARAMAQLAHPNIVAIFDVGHEAGTVYIAMEIVEGVTLKRWLARGPHPWTEIARVMGQAGQGLAAAHGAGLVHRDFKPSNVIVGADDRVRVLDFGLAATASESSRAAEGTASVEPAAEGLELDRLTVTGVVMGTPAYMAPEQHRGAPPDARSDQFSFAVVLFEALYGTRPYTKTAIGGVRQEIADAHMPAPAAGRRPPRALERSLARALATNPADRFATIRPLVDALSVAPSERGAGRRMALALGAGALVVGSWAFAANRDADPCREDADAIVQTLFGTARRDALATAFDRGDAPYLASTWGRIEPRLRHYTTTWASAITDACRAGERPEAPRVRCLADRREDLSALLSLLERGEPETLRRAAALTASLPPIADCATGQDDTDAASSDAEIADLLRRSRLLENAAQLDEARVLADEAVARAEASGSASRQADAGYRKARVLMAVGEYEEARELLTRVHHTAAAAEHDTLVALAATDLLEVVGGRLHEEDAGREWIGHARAAVARLDGDELMKARLLNNIGMFHVEFGRYDEAAVAIERTRQIRAARLPPDHTDAITSLGNLAAVYVELGRYEEALTLQEEVIERRRRLHGDEHPEVASALANYATALFEQRKLSRAREVHEQALAMRQRVLPAGHLDIARSLANLGSVVGEQGDHERARELYEGALKIREAALPPDHPDLVGTWGDLGITASRAGDYATARRYIVRAIEGESAALGADHPSVGRHWANLGVVEQLDDDLAASEAAYGKALWIFETKLGPDSPYVAMILNNLAAVMAKQDRYEESLPLFQRALKIHRAGQSGDNPTVAVILTGIGRSRLGLGETEAAVTALTEALELAERTELETRLAVETYLALAMALWDRNAPEDRPRARDLAGRAATEAGTLGPGDRDLADEIERWRAEHAARG